MHSSFNDLQPITMGNQESHIPRERRSWAGGEVVVSIGACEFVPEMFDLSLNFTHF
jgi:hypothetical protein